MSILLNIWLSSASVSLLHNYKFWCSLFYSGGVKVAEAKSSKITKSSKIKSYIFDREKCY